MADKSARVSFQAGLNGLNPSERQVIIWNVQQSSDPQPHSS